LIDGLPADTHRLGGFGLGLANGDDEKDRTSPESFLGVAADAAEILLPQAREYYRFPSRCQV